jgi:hypothetical protein
MEMAGWPGLPSIGGCTCQAGYIINQLGFEEDLVLSGLARIDGCGPTDEKSEAIIINPYGCWVFPMFQKYQ